MSWAGAVLDSGKAEETKRGRMGYVKNSIRKRHTEYSLARRFIKMRSGCGKELIDTMQISALLTKTSSGARWLCSNFGVGITNIEGLEEEHNDLKHALCDRPNRHG